MPFTTTTYKNLTVLSPDPTGAGSVIIQNNYKALANKSVHTPYCSTFSGRTDYLNQNVEFQFLPSIPNGIVEIKCVTMAKVQWQVDTKIFVERGRIYKGNYTWFKQARSNSDLVCFTNIHANSINCSISTESETFVVEWNGYVTYRWIAID